MRALIASASALVAVLSWMSPTEAATLRVPGDHATIQAAVLAGAPGDTVLVAPGTYSELIQMRPGIVLRSAAGPDSTILVAPGLAENPIEDRIVECLEGIERSTVIEGFTFDGGGRGAAGISCENASPTIRGNRMRALGWGINLRFSDALIEDNEIVDNRSFGMLIFASSPELYRNEIHGNEPNGITVNGKLAKPVIGGSPENANKIYANTFGLVNQSRNDLNATWNDWGWETAVEMESKGYPADIATIVDGNDHARSGRGRGKVDYRDWIRPREEAAEPVASGRPAYSLPVLALALLAVVLVVRSRWRRGKAA